MPLFNLLGRPREGWRTPPLPEGDRAIPIGADDAAFAPERDELDREVLGYAHPVDHAFASGEGRHLFAYRDAGGALAGYGYASEAGRVGPIAVRDPSLLAPVLAHLLVAIEPRGASSVWLAGAAGEAVRVALEAGLRFEAFPLLACWSAPFTDPARYVPISPGLL
jgi:hypothetical protein